MAPALGVALFIAAVGTLYLGILPGRIRLRQSRRGLPLAPPLALKKRLPSLFTVDDFSYTNRYLRHLKPLCKDSVCILVLRPPARFSAAHSHRGLICALPSPLSFRAEWTAPFPLREAPGHAVEESLFDAKEEGHFN